MKIALIYTSHHGTTEKVSHEIVQKLNGLNVDMINLRKSNPHHISITGYDLIILGSSVHAGQLNKKFKKFMQTHMPALLNTKIALFMSCMDPTKSAEVFQDQFPELLRKHAIAYKVTGGEFLFDKMNFIEKFLVRKITGVTATTSKIDTAKIDEFVADIKGHLQVT